MPSAWDLMSCELHTPMQGSGHFPDRDVLKVCGPRLSSEWWVLPGCSISRRRCLRSHTSCSRMGPALAGERPTSKDGIDGTLLQILRNFQAHAFLRTSVPRSSEISAIVPFQILLHVAHHYVARRLHIDGDRSSRYQVIVKNQFSTSDLIDNLHLASKHIEEFVHVLHATTRGDLVHLLKRIL